MPQILSNESSRSKISRKVFNPLTSTFFWNLTSTRLLKSHSSEDFFKVLIEKLPQRVVGMYIHKGNSF